MKNMLKRSLVSIFAAVMLFCIAVAAQAAVLTLPAGTGIIEEQAFDGAAALDSVVLPEGITAIGSRAFANSSLRSINLPRSITSIAADAFANSPNLTAVVKPGSYAMEFCKANGIPYEMETVVSPAEGIPISISAAQTSVVMGDPLEITLSADDGSELTGGQRVNYSIVFLNADNEVVTAWNYGGEELGTYNVWPECAGAVKMVITVVNGEGTCPGKNSSVEVTITGSDSYAYYTVSVDGMGYPGGKLRVSVTAINVDKLDGVRDVVVTDNVGSFTRNIGALSPSNAKLMADITVPRDFAVYDENGWVNDYYLIFNIGNEHEWTYWPYVNAFCDFSVTTRVGSSTELPTRLIPAEMPYTYAIADTNIATIDRDGMITGVMEGTTTGTLTTRSGIVSHFQVTVNAAGGSIGQDDPILYVTAPAPTYLYGTDEEAIFRIWSETESFLLLNDAIPVTFHFYDDNEQLVGSITDNYWTNTSDEYISVWTDWSWWDNRIGEKYRYVELCLDADESGYEVIEPSSARVRVIYPEELDKLGFRLDNTWGEHAVGETVTLTLTCTTPDLLAEQAKKGVVRVTAVANYYSLDIITNVQPAVFDADTDTASVTFTVGEDAVAAEYYPITLYCGADEVATYGMEIFSGLSRLSSNIDMLTGESCRLPFVLAEGASAGNLYFTVSNPSVATVNQDGIVTAHMAGYTEVQLYYQSPYGNTTSNWIDVNVYDPAFEDVPTLTVTPVSTSAAYGNPVQVKVQLSELITDASGEPAELVFALCSTYLDANSNVLDYDSRGYTYTADELIGNGAIIDVNNWITGSEVYSVTKMMIIPAYYDDAPSYVLDYDYTMIPVTDIPERGKVIYSLALDENEAINHGQWVDFRVSRLPDTIGADVKISLHDAEGNVLCTTTFYDGDKYCYPNFDTDDLEPGVTHMVYLYVDGVKIEDAAASFVLEESRLFINYYNTRMTVGETDKVSYYFSANNYDCDVTITSSDPTILSIDDENNVTALKPGSVTITAACRHGSTDAQDVVVYNPNGTERPVLSIYPDEGQTVNWMNSVSFHVGIAGDLAQIPQNYLYAYCYVQFLDEKQNVLYDSRDKDMIYRNGYVGMYDAYLALISEREYVTVNFSDDWIRGAELGAKYIRLNLATAGDSYDVDSDHSQITFALPDIREYDRPIVKCECPTEIGRGQAITVTFTCLNPNSLTDSRQVSLWESGSSTALAKSVITKDSPVVTLSYTPDEHFVSGRFYVTYPQQYGTTTKNFDVTVSAIESLGSNVKLSTGSSWSIYTEFSGGRQELTFTASDDSLH